VGGESGRGPTADGAALSGMRLIWLSNRGTLGNAYADRLTVKSETQDSMNYDEFLQRLVELQWHVPNRSTAYKNFGGWQVTFKRLGGRLHSSGQITFVICVRHAGMRNREKELNVYEREPHDYPFKLTLYEVQQRMFGYQSRLSRFDTTSLPTEDGWSDVVDELEQTIPAWLRDLTKRKLARQIRNGGDPGYIEQIWLEDLEVDLEPEPSIAQTILKFLGRGQ